MRLLVDQCLPRHLAAELTGHEATTVRAQRWLGLRNGILLRAAVDAGFEVFITNDSSVEFQQNVQRIGIAVIAIVGFGIACRTFVLSSRESSRNCERSNLDKWSRSTGSDCTLRLR